MIRKWFLIILICEIFINQLYSNIDNIDLAKPIKIKLNNYKKFETYLLCFTDKGFVIWNSSYNFTIEDISKYAEYHSFDELDYFQLKGKLNLFPLIFAGTLGTTLLLSVKDDDYRSFIGAFIISGIAVFGGILYTFVSMFKPRLIKPKEENKVDKFPQKYYTFHNDLPNELIEFIRLHEE